MTEFYSDQEVARMAKPRLLAAAASALAWLGMLGTALSTFMMLCILPPMLAGKAALAERMGVPLPQATQLLVKLSKLLSDTPLLAWLAVVPPLIALLLAYMWRSRLCSLLGVLLSLALIGSPLLLLMLSAM
jgi:type II secretory pathway component PulF